MTNLRELVLPPIAAGVLVAALMLSACGGSAATRGSAPTQTGSSCLRVWWWGSRGCACRRGG